MVDSEQAKSSNELYIYIFSFKEKGILLLLVGMNVMITIYTWIN